jgi:hypothetical protein
VEILPLKFILVEKVTVIRRQILFTHTQIDGQVNLLGVIPVSTRKEQTPAISEYFSSNIFIFYSKAPPADGDSVWIPANKSVTLDVNSPILKLLLIEGTLVFDNSKNLTLQAHYILLHNGGRLQIGTESKPYNNSGLIRLWGNIRSRVKLYIY